MSNVQDVDISKIIVEDRAREDMGEIEDLATSIRDKGLFHPIVIDQTFHLIAGGRRLEAFKSLKKKTIPCNIVKTEGSLDNKERELLENIMRKDLTWQERTKLVADIHEQFSKSNMEWTQKKTAQLLGRSTGDVSTHLSLHKAIEAHPELKDSKTEGEAIKKINRMAERAAISELKKRGEKTPKKGGQLANLLSMADKGYRIGDVFEGLAELPEQSEDIIFIECDPPYAIELEKKKRHEKWQTEVEEYIEIPRKEYVEFLNKLTTELYRVSAKNATIVFWFGIEWYREALDALEKAGFVIDMIPCMWLKKTGQTNQETFKLARYYESFFYGRKPDAEYGVSKQGRANVFEFAAEYAKDKIHPTQRPLLLIKELIETFAPIVSSKHTILSPFLGSGATWRAAHEMNMGCFGWDLNPDYKDAFLADLRINYEKSFTLK